MPLLSEEATSGVLNDLLREYREVVVWWGTWAECTVAISRLSRESALDEDDETRTRLALYLFAGIWTEVEPNNDIRMLTEILSLNHSLKTADTLQLAAALRWCEGDPHGKGFVCLDNRLRRAATVEGFDVLPKLPEVE